MNLAYRFLNGLFVVFLMAALFLTSQPACAGDSIPELFGPASSADIVPTATPGFLIHRTRQTEFHPAALDAIQNALARHQDPGPLGLTLFADTRLVARFQRTEPALEGGQTLVGTLDNNPSSEIHLSRIGDSFFASLNTGSALYEITALDRQSAQITQMDAARFPSEEDLIPPAPAAASDGQAPELSTLPQAGPGGSDDGSRIDVYVGYTSAARAADGGTAAIQSRIATAIAETNTGYLNSGINQRVVLMGMAEYAYDEASFNWETTLGQWRNFNGVFAPALTARDTLKADEMVLIVKNTDYCGLGYLMTSVSASFSANAFALVSRTCATGYYSFAHEMGHNMGAHHDQFSAGTDQGAYPYSYGYWIPNPVTSRYDHRTIMAYDTTSKYSYSAQRVNYWSNPNVSFEGSPVGAAGANNALTLNNTALTIAQFRDGSLPLAPAPLTATAQGAAIQLNWTFSGSDVWKFRIERADYGGSNWTEIGQTLAGTTTFSDVSALANKNYSYRVLSDNGNGRSVSNIIDLPSAPAGVGAYVPATGQVKLNWTPTSPFAVGYRVERVGLGLNDWTAVGSTNSATFTYTDTPPTSSAVYGYRIKSISPVSCGSLPSSIVQIATAPANLMTSFSDSIPGQVNLTWAESYINLTSILVERSTQNQENWTQLGTVLPGVKAFIDLPPNYPPIEYRYRVRSIDNNLIYSLYSNIADTLPNSPTDLGAAVVNQARIRLNWTDHSLIESGFLLEVSANGSAWQKLAPAPAAATLSVSYEVADLTCNTTFNFQIRAQTSAGISPQYSTLASPINTGPCVAPDQPALPVATPLGSFSIRLNWKDVDGETHYRVEQKINSNWDQVWTSSQPNITTYTISGLRPGTHYLFQVIAVNNLVVTGSKGSLPTSFEVTTYPAIFLPRITK